MRRDGPSLLPRRHRSSQHRLLAGLAFGATCLCVVVVNVGRWPPEVGRWGASAQFTAILMSVLLAHELGHLVAARCLGMRLSLPWFLPFPFLVGTLGAIIIPEEAPRDRTRLLLMAVSGPVAGALVLFVFMMALLPTSDAGELQGDLRVPLLWWAVGLHRASSDDPVQLALWVGCLVTWANLMPFGQLDGGHIWSSCFPKYARHASWLVTAGFAALSWWWMGWLLWLMILYLVGQRHPSDVRRPDLPLRPVAKLGAVVALAMAVVFAMPVPV